MPAITRRKRTVLPQMGRYHGDLVRMIKRRGMPHQIWEMIEGAAQAATNRGEEGVAKKRVHAE